MAKIKPERGLKTQWVREALRIKPPMNNASIAKMLNAQAQSEGIEMPYTRHQVCAMRSKIRHAN